MADGMRTLYMYLLLLSLSLIPVLCHSRYGNRDNVHIIGKILKKIIQDYICDLVKKPHVWYSTP